MVFRKLEQNVLYLEDYIEQHWKTIPAEIGGTQLSDNQRKDLFGARMVGRFKSVRNSTQFPHLSMLIVVLGSSARTLSLQRGS